MSDLYIFHGIDSKVGTTMISQSVAEVMAGVFTEKKVLFIALNGRESTDFIREDTEHIDTLKSRLESRMLAENELAAHCRNVRNLFVLGGLCNEEEERYYQPELAAHLIDVAANSFDIIVIDSGNRLDNGLAFGALRLEAHKYFIMTQQESVLARWEKRKSVYERLGVTPDGYILNSYIDKDIYPLEYIAKRLAMDKNKFYKIAFSYGGRRAEIERKTLMGGSGDAFSCDVVRLTERVIGAESGSMNPKKRKRHWKNFI
ncbi:MAG: hypothetical protein LBL49_09130 [Clostridiales Family XIII bacterium]|jgi:hypothetical protein|nr:hypothetical protein [Clostridiales Family XIII bacterium]